jgi:hypothetical protein
MSERCAVGAESNSACASLDQERNEVLESVMGVLAGNVQDPDELAACSYLLEHLARTIRRLDC